jgi:uncharacterized protein (TIGR00645 family)
MPTPFAKKLKSIIETIIFGSRWILTVFYFGLIVTLLAYTFVFCKEIYHMFLHIGHADKNSIMMTLLEIVDIVMIAGLIRMIYAGSYNSFVDKSHNMPGERISSGMLKVKMAMSIIGVSSIHLLQSFIYIENTNWNFIGMQLAIHGTFLIGYLMMAYGNYLHEKLELEEEKFHHKLDSSHKLHKEEKHEPKTELLTDSGATSVVHSGH